MRLNKKEYFASLKLGIKTSTGDIWGEEIERAIIPQLAEKNVFDILNTYLGKTIQTPPKVSAISVNGKRLYEYARKDQDVVIPKREIEIYEIELINIDEEIHFRVQCSSGTYIRSLCEDIAVKLGTVGTMSKLTRTKIEAFELKDAYTIEQIRNKEYIFGEISKALNYPIIQIDDITDVKNGKKLKLDSNEPIVMLKHNNEILAIYEKDDEQQIYRCLRGLW